MTDNFMTICPRTTEYMKTIPKGIPLRVIHSDGIEYNPDVKFTETKLSNGAKHFHNSSGKADSFSITVLINEKDMASVLTDVKDIWIASKGEQFIDGVPYYKADTKIKKEFYENKSIISMLDYYIREGEPFYITTRAVGINKSDLWIITENKTRKQNYDDGYVEWDLTFTKYIEYKFAQFKNDNKVVKQAIKKYKKKKALQIAKAKAKAKKTAKYKLQHQCKYNQLKYSKRKKVVKCVEYMQKILYNKGCLKDKKSIDGWYGKTTVTAVKNFQKKYAKKYKLKKTGKVDKATFKALYSV